MCLEHEGILFPHALHIGIAGLEDKALANGSISFISLQLHLRPIYLIGRLSHGDMRDE